MSKLLCLLSGKVDRLAKDVLSAIGKQPHLAPLHVSAFGLLGDEQADKRHHGGAEKALHHYAFEHYALWRQDIGAKAVLDAAGAFGENFSTLGMNETTVAVGDVFRLGTAVIEVSQGRQPCFKLNLRFDTPDMAKHLQQNGRTGWYYRVLEEGVVQPGDHFILCDRRAPSWTIERIRHIFYHDKMNMDALHAISLLPCLAESWRMIAQKRLQSGVVEDWNKRLTGEG